MMTAKPFAFVLLLVLPVAQAQQKELKLLQQYTQNPKLLGPGEVDSCCVTYMGFDTPLGFVMLAHLKNNKKAFVVWVHDPPLDLLKLFPNKTPYSTRQAGGNTMGYYKLTGGPFKGDMLEVIQYADQRVRYGVITPTYATARKYQY